MGYTGGLNFHGGFVDEWLYLTEETREIFTKITLVHSDMVMYNPRSNHVWTGRGGKIEFRATSEPEKITGTIGEFNPPLPTVPECMAEIQGLLDQFRAYKKEQDQKTRNFIMTTAGAAWSRIATRYAPGDPVMMNMHDYRLGQEIYKELYEQPTVPLGTSDEEAFNQYGVVRHNKNEAKARDEDAYYGNLR